MNWFRTCLSKFNRKNTCEGRGTRKRLY